MSLNFTLGYLAEGTELDSWKILYEGKCINGCSLKQDNHEPFIAVARFINKYLGLPPERIEEYHKLQPKGHKALSIMNKALVRARLSCWK